MDQLSSRSALGSDEVTDDTTSLVDVRWSSESESGDDIQAQCLAAPQTPIPSYKQRQEEFKKLFKEVPQSERLLVDYPCALQRDILLHGRLFLSDNWVCFYSNVFRGTKIMLTLQDITGVSKEKMARLIPNAIQISTTMEKYFFTSFSARDKSYLGVFSVWQRALLNKPLTCQEFWQMVKQHYGNDLGLSHEDMESLQLTTESSTRNSLTVRSGGDDDGQMRLERPPFLRIPEMDLGPSETSTPQGEDLPSPLGSQNSPSLDDSHTVQSPRRSPVPPLDRLASERTSKRSSHSVDLNANETGMSEQSGSESVEEVEDRIGLTQEVQGRLYLNKVFHISANKMFETLFTDSSFMRRFMNIRKINDITSTAWQKDASGNMKRSLNYTITISNPLIGKFSTATEHQTLYRESRDGRYYLIDSEVYTHDVPYHDYFYTQNRYYIISNSKRKCRLRVYTDVKYKKQPWGLVKSFITKNSWSGIEENFRHLEAELMEEEAEMNQGSAELGGLRRRRRTYSRTLPEHIKSSMQDLEHRDGSTGLTEMKAPYKWNIKTIVAGMSLILLILTLLNLGLFFKLWAMEEVAQRMYLSTKHRLSQKSSFGSESGPKPGPGYGTRDELHLLKNVLQDSINLLEQLRSSLVMLQKNFAMANQTAAQ